MTLQEAIDFFKGLTAETNKNSEQKVYDKFLHVLTELQSRTFSTGETQSIEAELASLKLNEYPENREKHLKKAFNKFEKYLKDTLSIIPRGYYTKLGIGLGSSFGILLGIVLLSGLERSQGIALGLSAGMLIGMLIGKTMDAQAKAAGKML